MSILTVKTDPITQHLQKDYERYCEQEEALSAQLKIAESAPSILAGEDYAAVQSEITALQEIAEKYINKIMPQLHSMPVNVKPMEPYKEAVSDIQEFIAGNQLSTFIEDMRRVQQVTREDVEPITTTKEVIDTIGELSGAYDLYRFATARDPDGRKLSFTDWLAAGGWTIISFTPARLAKAGKLTKIGRAAKFLNETEEAQHSLSVYAALARQYTQVKHASKDYIQMTNENLKQLLRTPAVAGLPNHTGVASSQWLKVERIGKTSEDSFRDVVEDVGKGTVNTPSKVNYGEQYTKINGKKVLKPNIEYKTKEGYHYKTDSEGRISNAEATLQLGKADRNNYAQRIVGREDRLPTDDGGHLIASIFKGSGEIDNLVPMNATLNRKEYKALETSWKKAIEAGKEVTVKVKPIYLGNSFRPNEFKVSYTIDGKKYSDRLTNYSGGK
ncbi:DNA/RNA non-specific endonuclease [Peribacillus sp. SCS-37]|uniref:DNA/RNA non-specific endonuclease n=1 Tax=Paraperibacillus esterisolvens TaxID=3115296 RepID=UPI0039068683